MIAVFADIHANVFALREVLADARKRGADTLINLGDSLYGPLAPRATYELLCAQQCITISGNQDRMLLEATEASRADNPTLQFVLDQLAGAPMDWLRTLPQELEITKSIFLCHGAPGDDQIYLLEDISSGKPLLRDNRTIQDLSGGCRAPVILCGHTHLPRLVTLDTGQIIINPGSVGLPAYHDDLPVPHTMENYSPHACYALLEMGEQGWSTAFIRVPYDHHQAAATAEQQGRHDWAGYLSTGRAE